MRKYLQDDINVNHNELEREALKDHKRFPIIKQYERPVKMKLISTQKRPFTMTHLVCPCKYCFNCKESVEKRADILQDYEDFVKVENISNKNELMIKKMKSINKVDVDTDQMVREGEEDHGEVTGDPDRPYTE